MTGASWPGLAPAAAPYHSRAALAACPGGRYPRPPWVQRYEPSPAGPRLLTVAIAIILGRAIIAISRRRAEGPTCGGATSERSWPRAGQTSQRAALSRPRAGRRRDRMT